MVKTITKRDISNYLNSALGFTKQESKQLVEHFLEEIKIALKKGEEVKLSGFGNFVIHHKNQRPGRNPKTGQEIPISARKVVTFHASQKLKERMQKNN